LIPLDKKDRLRQSSIWVDGEEYLIQTAFHYWINFDKKVKGLKDYSELDYLYKVITVDSREYGIPEDKESAYKELEAFFINKQPLPRDTGETGKNTVDFDIDSERIYCAFLEKYNINLITTDLHWHDFQANMFYPLDFVIGCRLYEEPKNLTDAQEKAEKKRIGQQRRYMWELEAEEKETFKMK